MKVFLSVGFLGFAHSVCAQTAVSLPEYLVNSPRIANQTPTVAFVMPVSALRYEPQVDIHARNLAESQSDVTIRGGTFENSGFQLGASTLMDPQTGHYAAEIPVSPSMLQAPAIIVGAGLAMGATNSTAGAIHYTWRPITTGGAVSVGFGSHHHSRQEFYQGYSTGKGRGHRFAADVALAHSQSRGAVAFGEHEFDRANVRFQLSGAAGQTDVFAGYQSKFFGWPNLYTPFNSNETEDLETVLFSINHRAEATNGDFFEAGAYHRRNKDDYAFNRFAPVGPIHPFQHTTWVKSAAVTGRRSAGRWAISARAEILGDELRSTSLTAGRYHTRSISKLAVLPEYTWPASNGGETVLKAGASYDDTSREAGTVSPVVELAHNVTRGRLNRVYASYVRNTQVPTYTALNSSPSAGLFRGNANLGRTRSDNIEAGLSGEFAQWNAAAAVFWRRDEGLVDWTFRRGVTARTANAVDVDVTGIELVARRSRPAYDFVVGYTYLNKDSDYRGAPVDASFYALNYARHRLTAALTVRLGAGFELRLDNVARIQAENSLRVVGGDEAVTSSVGLAYRPSFVTGVEASVQVDNLWGSDFQEVPAVPAMPRQMSAGVSYRW